MKNTTKLILIGIIDGFIALSGLALMWLAKLAGETGWLKGNLASYSNTSLIAIPKELYYLPYPGITLAMGSMIIALVTFFGLLTVGESSGKGWGLNKGTMRGAIAATILVVYLFVLSMNAFVPYQKEMPPMMEMMMTSFTTIIGIMIPFYFGASAYVQSRSIKVDTDKDTNNAEATKDQ